MKRRRLQPDFELDELGRSVAAALVRTLAAVGRPGDGRRVLPASIHLRAGLVRVGGPRFRLAAASEETHALAELRWSIEHPSTLVARWQDQS